MIVVDTAVLAHSFIETPESQQVAALARTDANWYAPYLWRSEFRNTMAKHMRYRGMTADVAKTTIREAEELMYGHEMFVDPLLVVDLVASSTCSAYDCEFVALAQELRVPLVTTDKQILRDFPLVARPLAGYR